MSSRAAWRGGCQAPQLAKELGKKLPAEANQFPLLAERVLKGKTEKFSKTSERSSPVIRT
jgi:hypothetical protein